MRYYKIDIENNSIEPSDNVQEDLSEAEELGKYILYKLRNGKIVFKKTGRWKLTYFVIFWNAHCAWYHTTCVNWQVRQLLGDGWRAIYSTHPKVCKE